MRSTDTEKRHRNSPRAAWSRTRPDTSQCDCGKYWTLGTSDGKYGEFIKWHDVFFSVNKGGFAYAKAGTEKGDKFIEMVNDMIAKMDELNQERLMELEAKAEEEDE